jgi:ABC-type phosphate transport system auxiliary subunit
VPVTAKLSRKFYEKLGDDVANELVEWFNLVDATYRSDLRELNELNFARFDAKLEQRWAQLDAKLEQRWTQLDAKLEQRVAELRAEMQAGFAQLETRLTRRLFGFWVAQAATTVALVLGVVKLTH